MLVHWFDRPYTGWLHRNDSKASIANGVTPEGFIGYAVNMVDLDINSLQIMTASDFGLRETVLFNLFKKLQVHETRENMVAARTCIEDGAVSLDGGILSENGILSLGYRSLSLSHEYYLLHLLYVYNHFCVELLEYDACCQQVN